MNSHIRPSFPATRWSVVIACQEKDQAKARQAMEELCLAYWQPLYGFARLWGMTPEDAEDATQEFLNRAITSSLFEQSNPEKGKLRNLLLTAFRRDLLDARRAAGRQKRQPLEGMVRWDFQSVEAEVAASAEATPEQLFDRLWAINTLQVALSALEGEYQSHGNARLFQCLRQSIDPTHTFDASAAAAVLNITEGAVRQALFRLRQRFRAVLRRIVEDTLASPDDALVNEELQAIQLALQ